MNLTAMNRNSNPTGDSAWDRVGNLNRILFNACIRNARNCGDAGNFEELLQWCSVAAWSASGQGWFGDISSRELEAELIRAAQQLPGPALTPRQRTRPRWLHVLTEAYETLGHTNLCRRWIQYDADVGHDVILLGQKGDAPKNLIDTVKGTGGECVVLDSAAPLMQRAADLRRYAQENADVVLLHTHPDEVLANVAFGVVGGPVVLVVNHADHVFWTGCSVADLILEIRMSGHLWTKQLRGTDRSTILPIPLAESELHGRPESLVLQERQTLRQSLGIPDDAVMLLTVGTASKYDAMPGLNFVATAQEIIRTCENAYLVAIGPQDDGVWKAANQATGGRILALGYQPDSTLFCRAADLYLEGFPLGSLTALLEACQAGLMCVRAPADCVLPFCSDSLSLDSIPQPKDVNHYIQTVVSLAKDSKARTAGGLRLQTAVVSQHCGAGWLARLREIKMQIPKTHQVRLDFRPVGAEVLTRNWFMRYTHRKSPFQTRGDVAARIFVEGWRRTDSRPRIDARLWAELKEFDIQGEANNGSMPAPGNFRERIMLWRLNRRISSCGGRNKLLAAVKGALQKGQSGLARRLIYHCLLTHPACLGHSDWLKQFVKTHIGVSLSARLRRIVSCRERQFIREQL
jgi:hypothetical protein